MRKRVRSVLTGLLMGCCVAAGTVLPGRVQAIVADPRGPASGAAAQTVVLEPVWTWIREAARTTGAFFASVYATVSDFFASGEAMRLLQSATHNVNDVAIRLLLPISSPIAALLSRLLPGASVTPEVVALWIFWIVIALILLLIVLASRPRPAAHRLPKVEPRVPEQEAHTIQFGMADQGPQPSPAATPDLASRMHEPEAEPISSGSAAVHPAAPAQPSPSRTEPHSIPEISLEPLGLFGEAPVEPPAAHEMSQERTISTEPVVPPLLEPLEPQIQVPESEASQQSHPAAISEPPTEMSAEALLSVPEETSEETPAPAPETAAPELPEPTLTPLGEQPAAEPQPPVFEPSQPAFNEVSQMRIPTQETGEEPAAADLLTKLLDEEESFPQAVASPAPAASSLPKASPKPSAPKAQSSVFSGDVDLDELLRDGVVTDATALAQLFYGGYRNRISKLAVSAKDLQNVPEEMRQTIKLTVVALSPIELSIARDLAMRLDAPGFVGEALLVAKKMGYEHYLTTYRNISKNYKNVSIIETTSLRVPPMSSESSSELISFN
ncbi:MAG: hypothetical protein ABFD13_02690 [Candidatus Cryosericum sp.]